MTVKTFISRPLLSLVISVFIVLLGVISLLSLPVERYPDIAPPAIYVWASYPGASAETVHKNVVMPLEEAINGVEIVTFDNTNDFLFASIREVILTLVIAIVLVLVVVLFFLQDFRATLIPAVGIVVSLIGTFAFMKVAGFSVNLLTLFALVLVIGTVVDGDDAHQPVRYPHQGVYAAVHQQFQYVPQHRCVRQRGGGQQLGSCHQGHPGDRREGAACGLQH